MVPTCGGQVSVHLLSWTRQLLGNVCKADLSCSLETPGLVVLKGKSRRISFINA